MNKIFNFKKKVQKTDIYGDKIENEYYEILNIPKIIVFSIIGLFVFITILSSFKTIKSGETGLKVRFGKIVDSSSLTEGINFKIPYVEKIVKVDIKVQKEEINVESSTKDMQIINTNVAVNYRIKNDKATQLYKTVGKDYKEVVLSPAVKESIKTAIAKYNSEEITTKRNEVSKSCLESIQSKVDKYGIFIEDFNLTDFSFSSEYTKAIEEKQVAQQKLEKAKLDAESKLVQAEATRKSNELLKKTLTDKLIQEKFIEKWDGKLPTTYAGKDIMSIFNLK